MYDKNILVESELRKLFKFREYPKSLNIILSKIIRNEAKDKPINEILTFFLELYGPKDKTRWKNFSKYKNIKFTNSKHKIQGYIHGDNFMYYSYDKKKKEYTIKLYDGKTISRYLNKEKGKLLRDIISNKNYSPIRSKTYSSDRTITEDEINSIIEYTKIKPQNTQRRILRKIIRIKK